MIFLIDHNIEGQALMLFGSLTAGGWLDILPIRFVSFDEAQLPIESSDRMVWRFAQEKQMILLTANRSIWCIFLVIQGFEAYFVLKNVQVPLNTGRDVAMLRLYRFWVLCMYLIYLKFAVADMRFIKGLGTQDARNNL
jgi:hypothetical protein